MNFLSLALLTLPISGMAVSNAPKYKAAPQEVTLRVYNSEDYINEALIRAIGDDPVEDYEDVESFQDYVLEHDNVKINLVYDKFDTNENMLSQMETGAAKYDLICTSDYMIQKMMSKGMCIPFDQTLAEREATFAHGSDGWEVDQYAENVSPFLENQFENISADINGTPHTLKEYSRGYMWGTLGLTYNPTFSSFLSRGEAMGWDEETTRANVIAQIDDWDSMWHGFYKDTFQIKDSMRDTFSMGLMHYYKDYLTSLKKMWRGGELDDTTYQGYISEIFNAITHVDSLKSLFKDVLKVEDPILTMSDEEASQYIVDRVQDVLIDLKNNCYGLEVDSGKTDITTGKRTGIGLAWSGDAIVSMDEADGQNEENANHDKDVNLYFTVPSQGGNIWFDGWVMPKGANKEYAEKFIDFLSESNNAATNMDYIGYTSFIGSDGVKDLVREWYDPRCAEMWATDEDGNYIDLDEDGEYDYAEGMEGSTFEKAIVNGVEMSWDKYNEDNDLGWTPVYLDYFFGDGSVASQTIDNLFYTDEIEIIEAGSATLADGSTNEFDVVVGRQFVAQYPTPDMIPYLAVMEDYGATNDIVLKMWENIKSAGSINTPIIVILAVEGGLALGILSYYFAKKFISRRLRKKRREGTQKA